MKEIDIRDIIDSIYAIEFKHRAVGLYQMADEMKKIKELVIEAIQALSQSEGEKEKVMREHALDFHIKCMQKGLESEGSIWEEAYLPKIKKVSEDFYLEYIKSLPPQTK